MASTTTAVSSIAKRLSCPTCSSRHAFRATRLPRSVPSRHASTSLPRNEAMGVESDIAVPRNAFIKARLSMELSRQKHYAERAHKSRSIFMYSAGAIILSLGITYASVPLYRAFCSATGFGGIPNTDSARFSPDRLYTTPESEQRKKITVHFEATASDTLPWSFEPQQRSVRVLPGETALAFYKAKNVGHKDLIGIATYNMTPEKIAPYFAKVECFCFEEQKIRAGEEVDLPVFFFIDRDIIDEPQLDGLDDVVLSYTFFRARRNDKGHAIPDAPEDVIQKSQGFENYQMARRAATAPSIPS